MHSKLMDYIIKILDYVAEHPDSWFELWNDDGDNSGDARYPRLKGDFAFYDEYGRTRRIARDEDNYWSMTFNITEDNLRYLVAKLKEREGAKT